MKRMQRCDNVQLTSQQISNNYLMSASQPMLLTSCSIHWNWLTVEILWEALQQPSDYRNYSIENQGSGKIFHLLFWPWFLCSFGWTPGMFFVCFAFKDILVGGCHGFELPLWAGRLEGGLSLRATKITLLPRAHLIMSYLPWPSHPRWKATYPWVKAIFTNPFRRRMNRVNFPGWASKDSSAPPRTMTEMFPPPSLLST